MAPGPFPAAVPGAVQLDYAKANGMGDFWYGENFRKFEWMESTPWVYATRLNFDIIQEDERLFFISGGIDFSYTISLNGTILYQHRGMMQPVELELTALARPGDELEVRIEAIPPWRGTGREHRPPSEPAKPAVSFGWDWHPRLVPLGIWEDTFLEIRPAAHLKALILDYSLSNDLKEVDLDVRAASSNGTGCRVEWDFFDPSGDLVASISDEQSRLEQSLKIVNPCLWWPNNEGPQHLYSWQARLVRANVCLDSIAGSTGFRKIKLVQYPGAWDEPVQFPKSRSHPPITIEINNRRIFAKGSNWVNPEIFPGICTGETYAPLLRAARDAHFNLLRCWGGAPAQKEAFFAQCDRLGLMVWQEFPLSCSPYPDDPDYLAVLESEAHAIISRLKPHPCHVMWCGGNELFNGWSRTDDQSHALRLLNKLCYERDRQVPFLPTSPVSGIGHGPYTFIDVDGRECWRVFQESNNTAYTEFGCSGPSPWDYIKSFIPEDELSAPFDEGSWKAHHAHGAWGEYHESWIVPGIIEKYFGKGLNRPQMMEYGLLLQAEGYRGIYEECRRQWPRCSMALNWCYNEPWPTAAGNSLLNWPSVKKPAYDAVRQACRPVMASARISRFMWQPGETLAAELWLLNDSGEVLQNLQVKASLIIAGRKYDVHEWSVPVVAIRSHVRGPLVESVLPLDFSGIFELELVVAGLEDLSSSYKLVSRRG